MVIPSKVRRNIDAKQFNNIRGVQYLEVLVWREYAILMKDFFNFLFVTQHVISLWALLQFIHTSIQLDWQSYKATKNWEL